MALTLVRDARIGLAGTGLTLDGRAGGMLIWICFAGPHVMSAGHEKANCPHRRLLPARRCDRAGDFASLRLAVLFRPKDQRRAAVGVAGGISQPQVG